MNFVKTLNHINSIDFDKNCIELNMSCEQNERNLKKAYENLLINLLVLG